MMFGQGGIDGESIFKLFDFLQREKKMPGMQRRGRCRYSSLVLFWMAYRLSYSGRCYRETSGGWGMTKDNFCQDKRIKCIADTGA